MRNVSPGMLELVARRFRLLGEPLRLRIVQALMDGERSVGQIVEVTEASQSNVSKHLQALSDGGLLGRRRAGNSIYYFIADKVVYKLCELMCASAAREAKARFEVLRTKRPA
jgi:DNA-binding transcriptional ArsR family regulator